MDALSEAVFKMREQSGFGLNECKNALEKLDGDINAAINYLYITGDCVCRKHKDSSKWTDEDYINKAKELSNERA
jgi:translation elongation factor EF-Ts